VATASSTDLFLSLQQETAAAAAAAAGGGEEGVSVALARSCQNTTFCPQVNTHSSVLFCSVHRERLLTHLAHPFLRRTQIKLSTD
jgi:hypothetical protein